MLITVPVLVALILLVQRTRQGKAMRATAQDREAAAMMGIDVNRTISFTFLLAGALAGAGGLVFALYFGHDPLRPAFGLGLIAFTAAVLGGIGNLPGAVLGALCIGFIEAFYDGPPWHVAGQPSGRKSIVFAILILILVFRPEGLLGERTPGRRLTMRRELRADACESVVGGSGRPGCRRSAGRRCRARAGVWPRRRSGPRSCSCSSRGSACGTDRR